MARDVEAGRAFIRVSIKDDLRGLKKISAKLKTWGASMAGIGKSMSIIGAGLSVPIALAVKNFADFDDAMLAVKGVTQATAKDWQMLTETAKQLGASTSFTAVQVASLMVELGRAGFNPTEIDAMTGAVLNLSRATGTESALSAGIMAASIRQFSLGATEATKVSDLLTATANKTFNTVEMLGEALSYAGPVAADFGMSMEETLAVLGALGNVGIQGSNSGTALRRMMIITGAEAEKLRGIFGVSFRDAVGNARPLVDVFEEINSATAGMGTGERAQKFNEAFGLLGITGASVMARNVGSVKELQTALEGAQGTAAKTAAEMDSGLGGTLRILLSAIEGVKIAIGNALSPTLMQLGSLLTNVSGAIKQFADTNGAVVVAVTGIIAAITFGGGALAAFGFALMGIGTALGAVVAVLGAIISPLGIVIGLVATGTAAFLTFTDMGRYVVQVLQEEFGQALTTVTETLTGIKNALAAGDIGLAGEIAMTGLKLAFLEATKSIRLKWHEFTKWLLDTFLAAGKAIVSAFRWVASHIAKAIGSFKSQSQEKLMNAALGELEARKGEMSQRDYMVEKARIQEEGAAGMLAPLREADERMGSINQLTGEWDAALDETAAGSQAAFDEAISAGEGRIADLKAQLAALNAAAGTATTGGGAAGDGAGPPPTPREVGTVIAAAVSTMPTASLGTFSAQGAGIQFAGKSENYIMKTAENTAEMRRLLKRIERQGFTQTGATFS